jgi:RND family efflux transporter MFP subunit
MTKKKVAVYIIAIVTIAFLTLALLVSRNSHTYEVEVKRGNIDLIVAARGKVEAIREADLAPKSLGRLKEIRVKEGDIVEKDDVIAVLENDEVKAQVEQAKASLLRAEAELKEARQNWKRSSELFQRGIISKSERDNARMKYDVALSQLKKAEADLRYTEALLENTYIRAPFSGKITKKFLDPGETITLEKLLPVVTISDMSKIMVRTEIDETDIRKVKIGQEAVITSDAYPGEEFRGRVVEISPAMGKKTLISDNPAEMVDRDILEIKIELDSSGKKLNLGLKVDVTIFIHSKKDVLVLPRKVIEQLDRRIPLVKVKENGTYKERRITTGLYDDENVEVVDGLKEGDIIILPHDGFF